MLKAKNRPPPTAAPFAVHRIMVFKQAQPLWVRDSTRLRRIERDSVPVGREF